MKKLSFRFVKGMEKSHRTPSETSNRNGVVGRRAAEGGGTQNFRPRDPEQKTRDPGKQ